MRTSNASGEQPPLTPVHGFNAPGKPILLHNGPLTVSGFESTGSILLHCSPTTRLTWRLDTVSNQDLLSLDTGDVELAFTRHGRSQTASAQNSNLDRGWFNTATIGSEQERLSRAIVHWMNLPLIRGTQLAHSNKAGERIIRWRETIGSWELTLDSRPDHQTVWERIDEERSAAVTHIMEIRKVGGRQFIVAEAKALIRTLQYGMSFALGRWVGPALPAGFDQSNRVVWEFWSPVFCEQGRSAGLAWWHYLQVDDLRDYLTKMLVAFSDPDRVVHLDLLFSMAIQANSIGFVEQRLILASSAIELLEWLSLRLSRRLSESKYKDRKAAGRLSLLLADAKVSLDIDADLQPALTRFAIDCSEQGRPLDGPTAVTRIRNRLVHPENLRDRIYHIDNLTMEAWLTVRHYLVLLVLHSINYTGSYRRILGPGGRGVQVERVPWAS